LIEAGAAALLAGDEALLAAELAPGRPLLRWYRVTTPAVVLGLAQRHRRDELVDRARCAERGVAVLERRAGGGLVLLDRGMLCLTLAVPLPHPRIGDDLTESYRWLGDAFAIALRRLGVVEARRLDTAPARAAAAELRALAGPQDATGHSAAADPARAARVARLLLDTCYGGPSPHEVFVRGAKLVGFAQVRRRDRALYQVGLLLHDQSALADLVPGDDEGVRDAFRAELRRRTIGLDALTAGPDPAHLVAALEPTVRAALDQR
jgi:lipoate---protein ligase